MQQVVFDLRLPDTHSNAKIPQLAILDLWCHVRHVQWRRANEDIAGTGVAFIPDGTQGNSMLDVADSVWLGMCCPPSISIWNFQANFLSPKGVPQGFHQQQPLSLVGSSFIILIKSSNLLKLSGLHFQFPPTMGRRAIVGRDKRLLEQLFPKDVNDWEGLNGVWTGIKHKDVKNEVMFSLGCLLWPYDSIEVVRLTHCKLTP